MHIAITGGAGFIGSQLADYFLKKNAQVTILDNLSWGNKEFLKHNLSNKRFHFVKVDLLNKKVLESSISDSIDIVFHLAANSDIMRGTANPEIDFQNTTVATFNLLESMRKKSIKKLFYTSGSGVYGDVGKQVTSENWGPLTPISMYGASKLSAEAMISAYVHLYDMRAWILRPANIIGPRATHGVIFDFINQLRTNPRYLRILGDGNQNKSYLYITDVISAIELILEKASSQMNIYNIASDTSITVTEIAKIIAKEMKLSEVTFEYSGGSRGWKGDVPIVKLNIDRLQTLGWKSQYSSRQAVLKTIQVLLKNNQ